MPNPAEIILSQLGGSGRLGIMIGATSFFSADEGRTLQFSFKGCREANKVTITLNSLDTYDIKFYKFNARKPNFEPVKTFDGIYTDMIMDVFEQFTGLYLTLHARTA